MTSKLDALNKLIDSYINIYNLAKALPLVPKDEHWHPVNLQRDQFSSILDDISTAIKYVCNNLINDNNELKKAFKLCADNNLVVTKTEYFYEIKTKAQDLEILKKFLPNLEFIQEEIKSYGDNLEAVWTTYNNCSSWKIRSQEAFTAIYNFVKEGIETYWNKDTKEAPAND